MNKRKHETMNERTMLCDINELCEMLNVGRFSALQIAEKSKAEIRLGRLRRFHVGRIREYLETL